MEAQPHAGREHAAASQGVVAGRYTLTDRLARGGMGEVYAAVDESTGRRVALKRMRPDVAARADLSASFMREYHLLAELEHPRIIEVYDYGVDAGVPYYTMELLDGQDLRELAPLPPKQACLYLRDVASSLALLHARRLLHRDLSPRNVRRTGDGRCKLLDFGTLVPFGVPPNVAGTPPIVPPEALRGTPLDPRSDLYSLGALAYFLLTGKHAHAVQQLEDLPRAYRVPLVRPGKLAPAIPEALDDLVTSLMALDPAQRPRTAAEVIDRLSAIGELEPDTTPGVAQSFLSSADLIGREDARNNLERRIDRALRGQGSTLIVLGEPGTGRTRMLAEAVRIAQLRGFVTVETVARGQRGTEALSAELVQALRRSAPEESTAALRARDSIAPVLEPATWNASSAPSGEARARLQLALTLLFTEVAQRRPLLVAIDDIERADELSAAFIAALAHEARQLPLVIVATRASVDHEAAFSSLAALRRAAGTLVLAPLDKARSAQLVASVFGDAPNLERVTDWLYRAAHGNPALTLELAEHLVARGVVRYLEGTWALPSDEIVEPVPAGLAQTLGLRLLRLSPAARAIAELMSVRRGGLSLSLAIAAGRGEPRQVVLALDELVREGIVEIAGDQHVFVQQAMRDAVRHGLSAARETALHGQLASALLAQGEGAADAQLEAGWHLVHTSDELQGAELLARIGPRLVDEGLDIASAVPAIEKALTVFEQHGRPLTERLRLRSQLSLFGYLYDYRLALKYGKETFDTLYEVASLALVTRLSKVLPGIVAFACVVAWSTLKRAFTPKRTRAPFAITAVQYFGRTAMGLLGMRATSLDGPGTAELLPRVEPLGAIPPPIGSHALWLCARVFALQPLGREAELNDAVQAALRHLIDGRPWFMRETERQDLLTGLLLIDGINESYRERSQALERAARLDAMGTQLASACAKRVRWIHYTVRGEREAAERERKGLDLLAIQGGTTWQVEWFAVPVEGLAGALIGDLLATRRALDKLDALLAYVPSLEPLRDAVRIGYHYRRGEHERVVELGESFVAKHAPRTVIGWGPAYALVALSMAETGQASRALELCQRGLAELSEADHAYFVMYAPLLAAKSWAYSMLGDLERAQQLMNMTEQRLAAAGEHAALAVVYDLRARVARRLGVRRELRASAIAMRRAALAAGNPALVASADRWAEIYARITHSSAPPATRAHDPHGSRATARNVKLRSESTSLDVAREPESGELTAVTTFLLGASGASRYDKALQLLAQNAGSTQAYLFACRGSALTPAAALDDEDAPELLEERIGELLARRPGAGQYVIELPVSDAGAGLAIGRVRFQIVVLAATDDRVHVAVAALREGIEPLARIRATLLDEVGDVLGREPLEPP